MNYCKFARKGASNWILWLIIIIPFFSRPFQQLCLQTISSVKLKKEYVLELLKYHGKRELYQQLLDWPIPQFPIKGNVLIANGAPKGPKLGVVLDRLKIIWSNNQYNMTQEQLLEHLPAVLEEINVKKK